MPKKPQPHLRKFAALVAKLRRQRDWSLREMGEAVGLSYQTLSDLEKGHFEPTLSTLQKLVDRLGVRPDEFFR